jgi:hypothetical protein
MKLQLKAINGVLAWIGLILVVSFDGESFTALELTRRSIYAKRFDAWPEHMIPSPYQKLFKTISRWTSYPIASFLYARGYHCSVWHSFWFAWGMSAGSQGWDRIQIRFDAIGNWPRRTQDIYWGYRFFRAKGMTHRDAWARGKLMAES